jgi:hypothetical protein
MKDVIDTHSIVIADLPNQQQAKKPVYPFRLTIPAGSCAGGPQSMVCYSQAADIKQQWIQSFENAKNIAKPPYYNQGHHDFELETFSKPSMCCVCSKLLWGTYFQGYMCRNCSAPCHMDCLKSVRKCKSMEDVNSHVRPKKSQGAASIHISKSGDGIPRPGSIYYALEKYDHPLFVSATNARRALMLSKGEEVEIADASDPNWWEVISLKTGNKGKVPPSYLKKKEAGISFSPSPMSPRSPEGENLRNQQYFVGCMSRLEAEQILHGLADGVFLIRESDQRPGQYAVALRWKKTPRHIKIQKHSNSSKLFVSDAKSFNSVEELVEFYRTSTLGVSFPGVDTTLKYPYWEVVPPSTARRRPTSTSAISSAHHPTPSDQKRISLPVHPEIQGSRSVRRTPSGTNVQDSVSPPLPSRVNGPNSEEAHWCEALFNFNAEYPDELSIRTNCRIKLLSKETKKLGWWLGEYQGKLGLFPANYVKDLS